MAISSHWRAGFEIEVVLGDLGQSRFHRDVEDPMDQASPSFCQAVAKELSLRTGFSWRAPRKSSAKPGFYVLPEYDLDPIHFPYGIVAGVELLTPPLPLAEAEDIRLALIDALDVLECGNFLESDISESCGWHINIDAGPRLPLEEGRYMVGVDEGPILFNNKRFTNRYAEPQRHAFGLALLRHIHAEPTAELLTRGNFSNLLRHSAGRGKRYAANFDKLDQGYLELRHFSTEIFLEGTPLSDLLEPIIASLEMDHESEHRLEERLIRRFQVLSDWLARMGPLLTHTIDRWGFSTQEGSIWFDGEKCGTISINGTVDLRINGAEKYSEISVIRDLVYSDLYPALALLALDIAELRHAETAVPSLASGKFSGAIDLLRDELVREDLFGAGAVNQASWWR